METELSSLRSNESLSDMTNELRGLEIAEKGGEDMDHGDVGSVPTTHLGFEEEFDDDEENEFLNSSSFLSNSQIIRSTNVANFNPTVQNTLQSPTRRDDQAKHEPDLSKAEEGLSTQQGFDQSGEREDFNNEEIGIYDHNEISVFPSDDEKSTRFIDIDDPRSTPKLPKMHPNFTPWRNLRPTSSIRVKETRNEPSIDYVQSLFESDAPLFEANSPARSVSLFDIASNDGTSGSNAAAATSTVEMEDLRKQITNYKLQQRILTEVIREILKLSGNGDQLKSELMQKLENENVLLMAERDNVKDSIKKEENDTLTKYNEKVKELVDLKGDLISMKHVNEELQSTLEGYKSHINAQEETINNQYTNIEVWTKLCDEILEILLQYIDGDSAKAIQRVRSGTLSITTALNVIKFSIDELGQKILSISKDLKAGDENEPTLPTIHEFNAKLTNVKQTEEKLKTLWNTQSTLVSSLRSEVSKLRRDSEDNGRYVINLRKLLNEKRLKISSLNEYIKELESQIEQLKDEDGFDSSRETQLLKNRLTILKTNHAKEIEALKDSIAHLTIELEQNKGNIELEHELSRKRRQITDLESQISSLQSQLSDRTRDMDSAVDSLKRTLQTTREEYDSLLRECNHLKSKLKDAQDREDAKEKEYRRKLEHAAKELNLAVMKQRALAAEKSKLRFSLEDCKRERSALTLNNNTLSEKVDRLSYDLSSLTNYEVGFKSLLDLQVHHLRNMLDDFEAVLERSSYIQAKQKLDKLLDSNLDFEMTHSIVRSLFAFFENAMGSLIEDHKNMLMNNHEEELANENADLHQQVETLQQELQWYYENANVDQDSPRTKLRISDLEKKRKAERERRQVEFRESQILVRKLEDENRSLKEKLASLSTK